jgi:hypothetical protein
MISHRPTNFHMNTPECKNTKPNILKSTQNRRFAILLPPSPFCMGTIVADPSHVVMYYKPASTETWAYNTHAQKRERAVVHTECTSVPNQYNMLHCPIVACPCVHFVTQASHEFHINSPHDTLFPSPPYPLPFLHGCCNCQNMCVSLRAWQRHDTQSCPHTTT